MKTLRLLFILISISIIGIPQIKAENLRQTAISTAEDFLLNKFGIDANNGSIVTANSNSGRQIKLASASENNADFYAYNTDSCFVLMVSDGTDMQIAGYSTNRQFSFEKMPDALVFWLNEYKKAVNSGLANDANAKQVTTPVAPMITTKWGQGAPYNKYCPKNEYNTTIQCLTGCVATAMAQILNFYQSDAPGYDKIEYVSANTEISIDFSKIDYDWSNMADYYIDGEYTDEQADAVARLMADAGAAAMSEYKSSATSASMPYVAFNRYYNYKCEFLVRDWVTTDRWIKLVQDELQAGRPILYGGEGDGAHTFVIDGIDAENNVHINWGWDGLDDGYYDINFCRAPSNDDEGYPSRHQMLIGLEPRTATDEPYTEKMLLAGYTHEVPHYNGPYTQAVGITTNFYSSTFPSIPRYIAFCLVADGEIVSDLSETKGEAIYTSFPGYYRLSPPWGDYSKVADGVYDLCCAYKIGENDQWHLMESRGYNTAQCILKTEGSHRETTIVNPFNEDGGHITVLDIEPAAPLYGKAPLYLYVTARNDYDNGVSGIEFNRTYYLSFVNKDDGKVYGPERFNLLSPYAGVENFQLFELTPTNADNDFRMPAGEYYITCDDEYVTLAEDFSITLKDVDYPVFSYWRTHLTLSKRYWDWNESFGLGFNVSTLEAANKVEGTTNFAVYLVNLDTGEEELFYVLENVSIPSSAPMPIPGNLYPFEGNYHVEVRYTTPDDGECIPYSPKYDIAELQDWDDIIISRADNWLPKITATAQLLNGISNLPNGEVCNIDVPLRNDDETDFSGSVTAYFYCAENGKALHVEIDDVNIGAGEKTTVTIPVTFPENGKYEMFLKVWRSINNEYSYYRTFVTNTSGRKGSYLIGVGVEVEEGDGTGVNDLEQTPQVTISPNPASDIVTIKGIPESMPVVTIYSTDGKLMTRATGNNGNATIDVASYPAGIYLIHTSNNVFKLIKH